MDDQILKNSSDIFVDCLDSSACPFPTGPSLTNTSNSTLSEDLLHGEGESLTGLALQMGRARFGLGLQSYYLPAVILMGLVGNTLSLLVMLQRHNRRISCCVYMAALAVTDNVVLCVTTFFWKLTEFPSADGTIRRLDCIMITYLNVTFSNIGVALIICMTVDRFLAIRFPLKSSEYCTTKRAKITIVVAMVLMMVYNIPYIIYTDVLENGRICAGLSIQTAFSKRYSIFIMIVNSVVPFVTLLGLNTCIIVTICTRNRAFSSQAQESSNCNNSAGSSSQVSAQERHLAVMLVLVSFALLCLTLPLYLRMALYLVIRNKASAGTYATYILLYHVTNKLFYTNNACNFLLYCIGGKKFREDLSKVMSGSCQFKA